MVCRAAGAVQGATFRQGCDQAVKVARLKLVGVGGQCFEIGDAVIVNASSEAVGEGQSRQHGEPTGTAATNGYALAIHPTLARQVVHSSDRILQVDGTPLAPQSLAVGTAKAGRAAVIDIDDGEAAGGPELHGTFEGRAGM